MKPRSGLRVYLPWHYPALRQAIIRNLAFYHAHNYDYGLDHGILLLDF
jgi:hypothetical protein